MKNLLSIVLFLLSFSCFSQSISPYFTRTRTLQLEGYSSTGVNIAYSYASGSVNSWTINDTLADQWVNQRINAILAGANFWRTDADFPTTTNITGTLGGSLTLIRGTAPNIGAIQITETQPILYWSNGTDESHSFFAQSSFAVMQSVNGSASAQILTDENGYALVGENIPSNYFRGLKLKTAASEDSIRWDTDTNAGLLFPTQDRVRDIISDSLAGFSGGGVTSFEGRTGAVTAQSGDYLASEVTNAFDKSADDGYDVSYTPATSADWPDGVPTNVGAALDSLADVTDSLQNQISAMIGNVILKADTIHLPGWNMDVDVSKSVTFPSGVTRGEVVFMAGSIFHDNGTSMTFIPNVTSTSNGDAELGFSNEISSASTSISVFRTDASRFNTTNYDDDTFSRGFVVVFSIN